MHKSFYHDEVFFDYLKTDAQNLQVSKDRFMTIFSRFLPTTFDLSQNWSSDNHFKVLVKSKSWLAQKLWHKTKIFLFLFFCVFVKKHLICVVFFAIFAIFAVFLHRNEAFSTKIEIHSKMTFFPYGRISNKKLWCQTKNYITFWASKQKPRPCPFIQI